MAGFRLNERIGKYAVWCWIIGFFTSFIPMYILGFMGATRRLDTYDSSTGWQPFYITMLIGGLIIALGVALQVIQIIASFIQKNKLRDATGDPYDGRTLEWSVPSPAPSYNFAVIPEVKTRDAFWEMKRLGLPKLRYKDIMIPENTAAGIYISIWAFFLGFAFVWHIVWLAVVSAIGIIVTFLVRAFKGESEYTIPAEVVEKMDEIHSEKVHPEHKSLDDEDDMGLIDFAKYTINWALGLVRRKRR
jgi:cytochrome o ubiquinol oxidase subunit 1